MPMKMDLSLQHVSVLGINKRPAIRWPFFSVTIYTLKVCNISLTFAEPSTR